MTERLRETARRMDSRAFSIEQTTGLLERLAFQITDSLDSQSPEAIRDLRVAIRRLTPALAAGKLALPSLVVKKIRQRTKDLMTLASKVRDCDIAINLVTRCKAPDASAIAAKLRARRTDAEKVLVASLSRWTEEKLVSEWRRGLAEERQTGESQSPTVENIARRDLSRLAKAFSAMAILRQAREPRANNYISFVSLPSDFVTPWNCLPLFMEPL